LASAEARARCRPMVLMLKLMTLPQAAIVLRREPTLPRMILRALAAGRVYAISPLLPLYTVTVIATNFPDLRFDPAVYLEYAQYLARGDLRGVGTLGLWWGPGYPIVLAPFVRLGLPLAGLRLLNA